MQGRNFFILLLFACFLLCSSEANAQKLTTNEDGEKIIVYPDGSWRYFDENDAEDVEEVEAAKMEEEKKKKPKKSKKKKNKKSKKKKSKGKKNIRNKFKIKKNKVALDPEVEEAARNEAIRRADLAAAKEEAAILEVEELVFQRIFLEEELAEAYQNVDMTHEDVAVIEGQLKEAKAAEKASKNKLKKAADLAKKTEKMIDMPKAKRDKLLAKMDGSSKKKKKDTVVDRSDANKGTDDLSEPYSYSGGKRKLVAYNPKNDVMITPPFRDCNLSFDGVDEFTGVRRKDVAKQLFFTYTPDRFKPYFKGRNYITCHGYLSKINDGGVILNLEFVILTEQAAREFGALEMGSQLTIRGIDGDRITLSNKKTSIGMADSLDKTTTYKAQYAISSSEVKSLRKTEVDKIRVIWGTGYEDYEVYEVDFLIDQFRCLK